MAAWDFSATASLRLSRTVRKHRDRLRRYLHEVRKRPSDNGGTSGLHYGIGGLFRIGINVGRSRQPEQLFVSSGGIRGILPRGQLPQPFSRRRSSACTC